MIYLIILILSLYIFDPFKRLNGGVIGWLRRRREPTNTIDLRDYPHITNASTYTKPEESLLSKFPLGYEDFE